MITLLLKDPDFHKFSRRCIEPCYTVTSGDINSLWVPTFLIQSLTNPTPLMEKVNGLYMIDVKIGKNNEVKQSNINYQRTIGVRIGVIEH